LRNRSTDAIIPSLCQTKRQPVPARECVRGLAPQRRRRPNRTGLRQRPRHSAGARGGGQQSRRKPVPPCAGLTGTDRFPPVLGCEDSNAATGRTCARPADVEQGSSLPTRWLGTTSNRVVVPPFRRAVAGRSPLRRTRLNGGTTDPFAWEDAARRASGFRLAAGRVGHVHRAVSNQGRPGGRPNLFGELRGGVPPTSWGVLSALSGESSMLARWWGTTSNPVGLRMKTGRFA